MAMSVMPGTLINPIKPALPVAGSSKYSLFSPKVIMYRPFCISCTPVSSVAAAASRLVRARLGNWQPEPIILLSKAGFATMFARGRTVVKLYQTTEWMLDIGELGAYGHRSPRVPGRSVSNVRRANQRPVAGTLMRPTPHVAASVGSAVESDPRPCPEPAPARPEDATFETSASCDRERT